MITRIVFGLLNAIVLLGLVSAVNADTAVHTIVTAAETKWGDAPPIVPPGAKLAVLAGDPGKPGLFVVRFKLPANYKIPAHWHPSDENITVISGAFFIGMGDKLEAAQTKAVPAGGFTSLPAKMNHFALTKKETVIEIASMGPFQMIYVNPADDPSKTPAK